MQYLLYNRAGAESFLEPKKSRPLPSQAGKNHRKYVYEKSVGPVSPSVCALGHCLIQLRVWRAQ